MKRFAAVLLIMGLSLPALATDLTVTYQIKEGKKNKGERTDYWSDQFHLSADKLSKTDALTDYAQGRIYTIYHDKKQIEFYSFKDMAGMMGGTSQMMGEMMNKPGPKKGKTVGETMKENTQKYMGDPEKAVLQKLGTLSIAGRTCDNYKVERKGEKMEMSEEVCIDPTLNPPKNPNPDAEQMTEAAQGMMGEGLGSLQSSGQKELAAIKGVPLKRVNLSKVKMMFGGGPKRFDEEAIIVKEGPIDPSIFKLPSGYKQIDQGQEMRQQMQEMQKSMGAGGY